MTSPQLHINKLPDKVLEEIFLNLVPNEISSIALPYVVFPYVESSFEGPIDAVCQRWSDLLSTSARLWRRVCLRIPSCPPLPMDFYAVLYRKAPAVKDLRVEVSVRNVSTRVFSKFPTFKNVTNLVVNVGPHLTPMEWALVVELFPNVEKFSVELDNNRHLGDRTLQQFAAGWPKLISIHIDGHRLTAAGFIQFVTTANRLQSISLDKIPNLTDGDIDTITRLLRNSLKSITFGCDQWKLSDLAVRSIVRNCPQLEEIGIWICTLNINVVHFKHLVNLRSLIITTRGPIKCEGLEEIFSRPQGQLRELEIGSATNVTDSLLTNIANGCPLLDILSLEMNDFYDNRSVTNLGLDEIVNKCRNLTRLVLSSFPLLTGSSFIGSRAKLSKLKYLRLSDCGNLDEGAIRTEFAGVEGLTIVF